MTTATAQTPAQRGPRNEFLIARVTPEEKLATLKLSRRLGFKGNTTALLLHLIAQAQNDTRQPAPP